MLQLSQWKPEVVTTKVFVSEGPKPATSQALRVEPADLPEVIETDVDMKVRDRQRLRGLPQNVRVGPASDPRAPGVELFSRATHVAPQLVDGPELRGIAAELCTRLDRMPLAIELPAARCGS